jgi:hypothetical protein
MNWARAITGVLVLWSSTAWGATLTWNANSEPDMAGYRVYQCSQQPCTRSSANASLLATLGKVTTFNIGTPSVTRYYFTTAYDFSNRESGSSNLVTFLPAGSPPPPPPTTGNVSLTVVGNPATGPWGANATTTNTQDVMAHVRLDGVLQYVENHAPYDFFPKLYGTGPHTVEFVFYLQNTTSEIGRASITVMEGYPAPSAPAAGPVKLTIVGNPATGPWGVTATTTNTQDVMAHVRLDGVLQYVENSAPYDFLQKLYGTGPHTVEFVFYLQNTTSEIGRATVTVKEGA